MKDIFLYAFTSEMVPGARYYRRFNLNAGFIEKEWYTFKDNCPFLSRVPDFDFVR